MGGEHKHKDKNKTEKLRYYLKYGNIFDMTLYSRNKFFTLPHNHFVPNQLKGARGTEHVPVPGKVAHDGQQVMEPEVAVIPRTQNLVLQSQCHQPCAPNHVQLLPTISYMPSFPWRLVTETVSS